MARKIIYKENGLANQSEAPSGYKYLGYDGDTLSEKSGATLSSVGGNPYSLITGYISLADPGVDQSVTWNEIYNDSGITVQVARLLGGLYAIQPVPQSAQFTFLKTVPMISGIQSNSTDNVNIIPETANSIRVQYRNDSGTYTSIGSARLYVEIKIYP